VDCKLLGVDVYKLGVDVLPRRQRRGKWRPFWTPSAIYAELKMTINESIFIFYHKIHQKNNA